MSQSTFAKRIASCTVLFLSETWLHDGEEDAVPLPKGFSMVASNRKGTATSGTGNGGVAFVYAANRGVTMVEIPKHPDILAVAVADIIVVGAYICPSSSKWEKWTEKAPEVALGEILAYIRVAEPDKRVVVLGDFNARIADRPCISTWERNSLDKRLNSRVTWLLALLLDFELNVLNGSRVEKGKAGTMTCHQSGGDSVVDYILWPAGDSHLLAPSSLTVTRCTNSWSDHSLVRVALEVQQRQEEVPLQELVIPSAASVDVLLAEKRPPWFPPRSKMDAAAKVAVASAVTPKELLRRAYGGTLIREARVKECVLSTYLKRSPTKTMTGVMVISGTCDQSARQVVLRIPDWASLNETSALFFATTWIMCHTDRRNKLIVYGPPSGFLNLVGRDLSVQVNTGYPASYGMCAELFVNEVLRRLASLDVRSPVGDTAIEFQRATRAMARKCWKEISETTPTRGPPLALLPTLTHCPIFGPYFLMPKVTAKLSLPTNQHASLERDSPEGVQLTGISRKKTRSAVRASMVECRQKLLRADGGAEWWKVVKSILLEL